MRNDAELLPTLGKPIRWAEARFPITALHVERDLYERIADACGGRDGAGTVLGGVIFRHACGQPGPISTEDRALNDFLFAHKGDRLSPHIVMSLHLAGRAWVSVCTSLKTGETTVRPADSRDVPEPGRAHRHVGEYRPQGGER